ncbi:hypothetical protein ES288_D06G091300v1 [Gossypium darwinii]|uniref:PHD finger protein ALFIN-LIKE n=1 Tax=Gossypium darwinii TaxID=34276 RepID=A0A5D2C6J3_GOSDA|nr:hypothetical protein ES288_D06G091300v1 [Gossypium darwinii]
MPFSLLLSLFFSYANILVFSFLPPVNGGNYSIRIRTVEDVFSDFKSRRAALIKALTTEKDNLCLFGYPNRRWEVNQPVAYLSPEIPEPTLGISFCRNGMQRKDWFSLVAVQSDAWLLAVAYFWGARFDQADRDRLFTMINDLPTLYDIVTESAWAQAKEKSSVSSNSSNKPLSTANARGSESAEFSISMQTFYEERVSEVEDDDKEHGETLCTACGQYGSDEFWICCDICERWYHCKCVKITPTKAVQIKLYKCPSCGNRRGRPSH